MKKLITLIILILSIWLISTQVTWSKPQKIQVTSSSFENKGFIPDTYACDVLGENKSPPLVFSNIPEGTKSLALVLDDQDAPGGIFNHWVILYISPAIDNLGEGLPLDDGVVQGTNGTNQTGYFGPCPPPKETHRYVFKVFALDKILDLPIISTKKQLFSAMKSHILGKGKLVGLYKNKTNL
ncbi:MAG: hypothetical protein A3B68_09960 [Candidatus Melainabacteria bacterium RIFCSPHIGHO2_02_FULL_34_12]|nr:MAG: hypothetical protein A3B68_09960 [Candidatus Melainabacteria bacterium RIFCSPHIGHO2_02_FULL_34_12]